MTVFISYSRKDRKYAKEIHHILTSNNIDCWMDQKDISTGHNFDMNIARALANSQLVLVVMTPHAAESQYVCDEIAFAKNNDKPIIPISVAEVPKDSPIMLLLGRPQWLFYNEDPVAYQKMLVMEVCKALNISRTEEQVVISDLSAIPEVEEKKMTFLSFFEKDTKDLLRAAKTKFFLLPKKLRRTIYALLAVVILLIISPFQIPIGCWSDVNTFKYLPEHEQKENTITLKVGETAYKDHVWGGYFSGNTFIATYRHGVITGVSPGETYVVANIPFIGIPGAGDVFKVIVVE